MPVVCTSALSGEGMQELKAAILAMTGGTQSEVESGMLTNLRQSQAVMATLASLEVAGHAVEQNIPHEMVLLGEPVSADIALSWGLINRLVEDDLDGAVAALSDPRPE